VREMHRNTVHVVRKERSGKTPTAPRYSVRETKTLAERFDEQQHRASSTQVTSYKEAPKTGSGQLKKEHSSHSRLMSDNPASTPEASVSRNHKKTERPDLPRYSPGCSLSRASKGVCENDRTTSSPPHVKGPSSRMLPLRTMYADDEDEDACSEDSSPPSPPRNRPPMETPPPGNRGKQAPRDRDRNILPLKEIPPSGRTSKAPVRCRPSKPASQPEAGESGQQNAERCMTAAYEKRVPRKLQLNPPYQASPVDCVDLTREVTPHVADHPAEDPGKWTHDKFAPDDTRRRQKNWFGPHGGTMADCGKWR
jgi:hypothetical protein